MLNFILLKMKTNDVKKLVERANLMVEFLEYIDMDGHYYLAREWELDGPLAEIPSVLNKVKNEEEKEELKSIIFTNLAMKPEGDMTRFVRNFKNLVDTPQFQPFIDKGMEISEEFLEKFDEQDEITLDFIKEEVRSDEKLKEEMRELYEINQEKVKKRNTLNAPKKQIEKAIEALRSVDSNIVINLKDDDYEKFKIALEELEEEVKIFKKEVYGNADS